jgi:hypothetical protein
MSDAPVAEQEQEDRFAKERKYLRLHNEKKANEKRNKEINGELADLNEDLREAWAEEGVKNIPLDGQLLYLKKEGWVKVKGLGDESDDARKAEIKARAIEALKECNYGDYISETYNSQSISSLAREEHWDMNMPEGLEEIFEFEPDYKVAVKKQG